jgi:hypothetical protein
VTGERIAGPRVCDTLPALPILLGVAFTTFVK